MVNKTKLLGATAISIILITAFIKKKIVKSKKKSRIWVRKWINRRLEGKGVLCMLNNELLTEDHSSYKSFLHMSNDCFEKLFNKLELHLTKQDTVMRESIPARSK